jgi:hypothetical protein
VGCIAIRLETLDLTQVIAYIRGAMNRIILALLALFAGLVTDVAPANARMTGVGEAEIGAVEFVRSGIRQIAEQVAGARAMPVQRVKGVASDKGTRPQPRPPVYIPTVQFGADRAYE